MLVDRHHASMIRTAARFVSDRAIAEEVVQETWVGVLKGVGGFSGNSSLKTWLFAILLNQARRCGASERRSVPFSGMNDARGAFARVDGRRVDRGHGDAGSLGDDLVDEGPSVEDALLAGELRVRVMAAVRTLPPSQQAVMTLRDLQGWSALEVC